MMSLERRFRGERGVDIGGEELAVRALRRRRSLVDSGQTGKGGHRRRRQSHRGRVAVASTGVKRSSPRVMSTAPVAWIFPEVPGDPVLHGYGHWPRMRAWTRSPPARRAAAGGRSRQAQACCQGMLTQENAASYANGHALLVTSKANSARVAMSNGIARRAAIRGRAKGSLPF